MSHFSGCGLAGLYSNKTLAQKEYDNFKSILNKLYHRGPEHQGIWNNSNLILGHTRLSILDLSQRGNQPMTRGHLTIVSNGEIYNFKEIRNELINIGYCFSSDTDTEVMLFAFEEWGIDCLHKFNGMFAFAIWNDISQELILARDRLGVKPLYYYNDNNYFLFGSEIPAFIRFKDVQFELNKKNIIQQFLASSFFSVQFNQTLIDGIFSLPPASYMVFSEGRIKKIKTYWEIPQNKIYNFSMNEEIEKLQNLAESAISYRLISDVPVSAFLSGGLDSSIINVLACKYLENIKLTSVTVSFEGKGVDPYSNMKDQDLEYSKILVNILKTGLNHKIVIAKKNDINIALIDSLIDFASIIDDDRLLPIKQNYEIIHKMGLKVVLNGQGADEIMGGYAGLEIFYNNVHDVQNPNKELISNLFPAARVTSAKFISHEIKDEEKSVFENVFEFYNELSGCITEKAHRFFTHTQLQRILRFEDYLSMQSSVECRVPFLDHRIVEWAFSIPFMSHFDVKNRMGKMILRKVAERYLPNVLTYRPKQAFPKANKEKSYLAMKKIVDEHKTDIMNSNIINMLYNINYLNKNVEKLTNAELWQLLVLWRTNVLFNKETQ